MTAVAVIGHGPSPQSRGWGPKIDATDIVIRMFDNAWQAPADYGSKYDIGAVTMSQRALTWFAAEATRKPTCAWWVYKQDGYSAEIVTSAEQVLFDLDEEKQLAFDMGAETLGANFAFTRGTAAALMAIRTYPGCELVLVGFDEVGGGAFMRDAYPDDCLVYMKQRPDCRNIDKENAARAPGLTRTLGHDVSVEMAVIEAMATRHGVTVRHADEAFADG